MHQVIFERQLDEAFLRLRVDPICSLAAERSTGWDGEESGSHVGEVRYGMLLMVNGGESNA